VFVVAEVDLNVVCKNCGAEVSPYITECPYCGHRLRKRAPKLKQGEEDAFEVVTTKRRRFGLRRRRARRERAETPLSWMAATRPYATLFLITVSAAALVVERATNLSLYDMGAIVGPLDGDFWRLAAAQFNYDNVGYLFVVGVATVIFGSSLERRYGRVLPVAVFLGAGAAGMALAVGIEEFPIAMGGNGSALGLLCAWLVRDARDRRSGYDTESDLLGVGMIATALVLMPLLETTADAWVGLGGAAVGAVVGSLLPQRQ
jgi:membrane associated rhomboid family serine protease